MLEVKQVTLLFVNMRFVYCVCLLFINIFVSGQESYSVLFRNELNEGISSLVEDNNGAIVAVGFRNLADNLISTNKGTIWKVNSANDTLSKMFVFGDTASVFNYIGLKGNGNYIIIANFFIPPEFNLIKTCFMELDNDLNIIVRKYINLPNDNQFRLNLVKEFNNDYYLFGSLSIDANTNRKYILKLNSEYDTICTKIYSDIYFNGSNFMDCILSPDSSQLWTFCDGFTPNVSMGDDLFIYDTTLNFQYSKPFPSYLNPNTLDFEVVYKNNMTAKMISNNTFLIGCNHLRTYNHQQYGENDIGFSEMDSTMSLVPITYFGAPDTSDYASYFCGTFDFNSTDSIRFTGTKNQISDFWPHEPSWIKAGMLNRNMQPYFDRYYGGDAYYQTMFMKCTRDGGSIITARRYDYTIQNNEWDVFFLKLNSSGLITGVKDQDICPMSIFRLYPNPAHEKIKIVLAIHQAKMRILNLQNKIIIQKQIPEGESIIDISELPVGTYICEITGLDGEIFTNKWIKL